jgi:hypothetical protein
MLAHLPPDEQRQALALAAARLKLQRVAQTDAPPEPNEWLASRLGEHAWSKQREIMASVQANRRTAVKSCHGSGKSYIASRIAAWWMDTHPTGDAFVISTAPSFPQVRAILWREINRAHRKGKLRGTINQTEWWIDGEMVGMGRKPSEYDPAAFQGIHAAAVLVVIDEACGVPKSIYDAADTLITNDASRILAIGNPDDPSSEFATICKPASGWNVIRIRAEDTPNLSGEEVSDSLRELLISKTWVEEKAKSWGKGSPLYIAKVEGEFPENAEDTAIPLSFIRAAQTELPPSGTPVELGVDVGGGGDETVIWERRGNRPGRKWTNHDSDSELVVDAILHAIHETGATRVKVDTIGIGWGVAGSLERRRTEGKHAAQIVKVNVGESSTDPMRFPKLRDELWWTARELIQSGALDLTGLDEDTIAQLTAPKYGIDAAGRVKIEPKADTKARIGRSPDHADAWLLAFLEPSRSPISGYYQSEIERLRAAREKAKETAA